MVTYVPSAPVMVAVQVKGTGYASDIFRDLVASFNVLQGGNITVISRKCLLEASEPDYITCFILGTSMTSLVHGMKQLKVMTGEKRQTASSQRLLTCSCPEGPAPDVQRS